MPMRRPQQSGPATPQIDLNVARVSVDVEHFAVGRRQYEEGVRHNAVAGWDIQRYNDWLYTWPTGEAGTPPDGWDDYTVTSANAPQVFWRSVERGLARALVARGFAGPFGKGRLLVEVPRDLLGAGRSGLLARVNLHPAFHLDFISHAMLKSNERLMLAGVRTMWRIGASVADLHSAGLDCREFGVRLEGGAETPYAGMEGRLVGTVAEVDGDAVVLADPRNPDVTRLPANILFPEASHANLRRAVDALAPERWPDFSDVEEVNARPRAQLEHFRRLVESLAARPVTVIPGVAATVQLEPAASSLFPALRTASPELVFDHAAKQRDVFVTRGLKKFGPYDTAGINRPRFLVIGPKPTQALAHDFFGQLVRGCESPDPSKPYLGYAGFRKLFRGNGIEWDYEFFDGPASAPTYRRALVEKLNVVRPDLILVIINEADKELPEADDPYCVVKAAALGLGFPVSALTVEDMSNQQQRAFILHNVALQGFAKMGGTPYVLPSSARDVAELVFGVGRSDIMTSRFSRRRLVGYASVFKANGDYLLSTVRPFDRPATYETELQDVVATSLREAIASAGLPAGGRIRLTFHLAKRPGQRHDIAPVQAALTAFTEYKIETAYVHVSDGHAWLAVARTGATGVPERGTMICTGPRSRLLCIVGAGQYLGRGTPTPLRIDLDSRSTYGEIDAVAQQVFGFTAVTWRGSNVSAKPVTIQYAELACDLAGRLEGLEGWNATALDALLRDKRWFL